MEAELPENEYYLAEDNRKSDQLKSMKFDIKSTSTVNFDMSLSSLDQKEEFSADHPEIHFTTLNKLFKRIESSKRAIFEENLHKLYNSYNSEKNQNEQFQKDNLELLEKVTRNQEHIDLLQEQLDKVLEQINLA